MTMSSVFWSLVKQDIQGRKRRKGRLPRPWRLAYWVAAAILVIAITTFVSLQRDMDLNQVWYLTFFLPFMVFGVSTSITVREWKNGTAGWWLSLPLSRLRLVTAKLVAALVRGILTFAGVYCAVALLALYAMLLNGSMSPHAVTVFLTTGLKWYAILICVCPFIGAFGTMFGVLIESRAKPAIPLIWMVFGVTWSLVFSHDSPYLKFNIAGGTHALSLSPLLCYPIVASWILAYLMIRIAAYLLDRQLAL